MSKQLIFIVLASLAFLLLLLQNFLVLKNGNEGYAYILKDYNSVYYLNDLPSISEINNINSDYVEVVLNENYSDKWEIIRDSGKAYISEGIYPRLLLPPAQGIFTSSYRIIAENKSLNFTMLIQRQDENAVHIINSSIPVINSQRYSMNDFVDISWIENSEQDRAKQLAASLKTDTCSNTLSKIRLVTSYLKSSFRKNPGTEQKYIWNEHTAWNIMTKAMNGETSLSCNEYSEIYYLIANAAGISTRRVAVTGRAESDGVAKLSGHHFNESFIPEQNRWAFVDITTDKAYIVNSDGNVLNTFELFMANVSANYSQLKIFSTLQDSVVLINYSDNRQNEDYYFNKDCVIQYKYGNDRFNRLNQLTRFIYNPEPVLSLNYNNNRLYLKYALFIATAASVIILAGLLINYKPRHASNK